MKFPLQQRASRKTLSAEDLLDYALETGHFETIAVFGVKGSEDQLIRGDAARELLIASYR